MSFLFTISDKVHIKAPIERCFLLSTDIELVGWTLGMKPVDGKRSGRIVAGDTLLWAGWKFGLPQMHETLITGYDPPHYFQDTMGRGRFRRFQHDHYLSELDGYTVLSDKIRFSMPFGLPGRLVGRFLMMPYIARTLRRRLLLLQRLAEGDEWKRILPDEEAPALADPEASQAREDY